MKMRKKFWSLLGLFLLSGTLLADSQEVLEINVDGMTCAFCVYGVEKNLGKLDGVDEVAVSLESKKARVVMRAGVSADEEKIREIIRDAGFTPAESHRFTTEE